ncbi:MAG: hypothetical protein KGJ62_13145 [Armatimonadetes bacterium]|nr:hypothetical protein [Armatimonadota bacterium]MDE2206129.1 hypothetical protein [Armatimonadota bacterium]
MATAATLRRFDGRFVEEEGMVASAGGGGDVLVARGMPMAFQAEPLELCVQTFEMWLEEAAAMYKACAAAAAAVAAAAYSGCLRMGSPLLISLFQHSVADTYDVAIAGCAPTPLADAEICFGLLEGCIGAAFA